MATLAGRLLGAQVKFIHPRRDYSNATRLVSLAPRRRGGETRLLIIAAQPGDLLALARPDVIAGRFSTVGAWIFDSFWSDRIPRFARSGRHGIDHLWITDPELVDHYTSATGIETDCLPWGTDALGIYDMPPVERSIDVLRLGRQPAAWTDDSTNDRDLAAAGLTYEGRFPLSADGLTNQRRVIDRLRRARVVLASGSLSSPADYSHPTRDYISARFTDAAACGTPIVGARPTGAAANLISRRAFVDIEVYSRASGIAAIIDAVQSTTDEDRRAIRASALESLDWRHRFREIAAAMNIPSSRLEQELAHAAQASGTLREGREIR